LAGLLFWTSGGTYAAVMSLHHDLVLQLNPAQHSLQVEDRLTVPRELVGKTLTLYLHRDLEVTSDNTSLQVVPVAEASAAVPLQRLTLSLDEAQDAVVLRYRGQIYHPVATEGEEYARSFSETPGLIDPLGVYLAQSSYWYPQNEEALVTFTVDARAPAGWEIVSQGERTAHQQVDGQLRSKWEEGNAQEEIYLIAARFTEYSRSAGAVQTMAFLREPDAALANRYLEMTGQFLELYRQLIGPYPYAKFALVENFWETGYGMPSFTLLGPKVIRLPFILYSSYPHEILHNWWGNGVYVDYQSGNWAEGLTSYLADHLFAEQRGEGAAFRRGILQNYTDFVGSGKDFPLTDFVSRHSSSSEAIGYGKTQMLFHMLRGQVGDDAFVRGLHKLYSQHRFTVAGFSDVQASFAAAAQGDLQGFFDQWVKRSGAPQLRVSEVGSQQTPAGWRVRGVVQQNDTEHPYALEVPIAVTLENAEVVQTTVALAASRAEFDIAANAKPLRVDVDPEFDVFRRLDRAEIPPALSRAFGAERALMVLPAAAPAAVREAYRALAQAWQQSGETAELVIALDTEIDRLPDDRSVWILGWENRYVSSVREQAQRFGVAATAQSVTLDGKPFERHDSGVVLTLNHPAHASYALAWIADDNPAALSGLARKLPHYRRYSYLAFRGDEPQNVAKGQWIVRESPMTVMLTDAAIEPGKLAARAALAQLPPVFSEPRMLADVAALADASMEGRGLASAGIARAAEYLANAFRAAGLKPGVPEQDSYFQHWTEQVPGLAQSVVLRNVIGFVPGNNPQYAGQSVVVTAHYDHLGFGWPDVRQGNAGKLHPGADDNASGVAVMLELARMVAQRWEPARTIVFVAFTAEEAGRTGSQHYVRDYALFPASKAIGVINLDTVGRLGKAPLTIFGTSSASEWVHIFRGAQFVTGIEVNSVPNDFGSGDQRSFLDIGVPAVQLFGTAHGDFHAPGDTVDKIDGAGLMKVAAILKEAVQYLAERPQPLTAADAPAPAPALPEVPGGRRVRLGTLPDFDFSGPGVRIAAVEADSPAAAAGLQAGDIIIAAAGQPVDDLQAYGQILRSMTPGQRMTVSVLRGGETLQMEVELAAR
jgi:hypothetical protein